MTECPTAPVHRPHALRGGRARRLWAIGVGVARAVGRDHVSLISAGLAMYALLSIFPGLTAAVSLYGLFSAPNRIVSQMAVLSNVLPPGTWQYFSADLQQVASHQEGTLTIAAAVSVLVALWSARAGVAWLLAATSIAYGEPQGRGLIGRVALSLLLTGAAVVGFVALLTLAVAVPLALRAYGASLWVRITVEVLRWTLLWCCAAGALGLIYRLARAHRRVSWGEVMWGSVIAASLWLAGSGLFAEYVTTFGRYQKTYGALGGVVVLLLWLYLSGFCAVLGAEINAELERSGEARISRPAAAPRSEPATGSG